MSGLFIFLNGLKNSAVPRVSCFLSRLVEYVFKRIFLMYDGRLFLCFLCLHGVLNIGPFIGGDERSSCCRMSLRVVGRSQFRDFCISITLLCVIGWRLLTVNGGGLLRD